jgi:hypothetical protein
VQLDAIRCDSIAFKFHRNSSDGIIVAQVYHFTRSVALSMSGSLVLSEAAIVAVLLEQVEPVAWWRAFGDWRTATFIALAPLSRDIALAVRAVQGQRDVAILEQGLADERARRSADGEEVEEQNGQQSLASRAAA